MAIQERNNEISHDEASSRKAADRQSKLERLVASYMTGKIDLQTFKKEVGKIPHTIDLIRASRTMKTLNIRGKVR